MSWDSHDAFAARANSSSGREAEAAWRELRAARDMAESGKEPKGWKEIAERAEAAARLSESGTIGSPSAWASEARWLRAAVRKIAKRRR